MGAKNSTEQNQTEEEVAKTLFGDSKAITYNVQVTSETTADRTNQSSEKSIADSIDDVHLKTEVEAVEDWKAEIYKKLDKVFRKDVESFVRVQFYLDEEQKIYQNDDSPPSLKTLKLSLNNDKMFKTYAMRLAEDTKTAEKNPKFKETMNLLWSRILDASEEEFDESDHQSFDVAKLADDKIQSNFALGFARAWSVIPHASRQEILAVIRKVVTNRAVMNSADEVVGFFSKGGGSVVMVALAAVSLAYDVINNIKRWWNGEITGKRCLKNIIDSSVCIGAGVTGGVAGAALGSLGGPVGTLLGGVAGGVVAGQAANILVDRITQWIFGIPKEEALENAYKYLGVSVNASNNEINTAYRRLCLTHHPDKGGSQEDFHFVQYNMAVIKAARGQPY